MKRLDYQEDTVERFTSYLETLVAKRDAAEKFAELARQNQMEPPVVDWCGQTWEALKASGALPKAKDASGALYVPSWLHREDGIGRPVPNVCLKLPTGAGKTYLATRGIEQLQRLYYRRAHGLVLWIVPSDAIYSQTWKNLANREHPYRMTLERASGGRVKLLRRGDTFTKTDVENYLCVFVMMMAAAARQVTDVLKMFQDTGNYPGFFPEEGDEEAHKELRRMIPNLEAMDLTAEVPWGAGFAVKQSLGNVLCLARPTVILDEGHTAFSPIRRATLAKFNPSFILELSATPNRGTTQQSNVLHSVSGMALKKEDMVKLPLILHDAGRGDWKDTLAAAHGKLRDLQALAERERDETGRYVRPILLIRVERVGKDQTEAGKVHANDVRNYLFGTLGAKEGEVAEKHSALDELSAHDLKEDKEPAVRYIITKDALREGWDCPFAYVLAVLDATTAGTALTQMIGRILRQPDAERFAASREELNQSHVFVRMGNVAEAVRRVQEGLESEGMGDLGQLVRTAGGKGVSGSGVTVELERRPQFQRRIFLPRILAKQGDGWRLFDYESDLYPEVPWETLEWKGSSDFSPDDASALAHTRVAVDVDQLGSDPRKPLGVKETGVRPEMDFPALVRLLADVIPSPWQAARILRNVLAELRTRGLTEEQLLASRYRLLEAMRADLLEAIHEHTERVFCDLLARGELSFRLEGKGLSWELWDKLTFEVTQPPDYPLDHTASGKPVSKSLFERIWNRHFNGLEKDVALYIDDLDAVRWWHRIAVQADWYLDGWKKKRVFPDFLVALEEKEGRPSKLVVVETKGLWLKNEDTKYKEKLFEVLERHSAGGVPVGELSLDDTPGSMRFRVVFEGDWKSQVNAALAVAEV
ncbi:MAG: DEAD/DEAH box helicase family protein [Chthoniobacteraceae bacterium]